MSWIITEDHISEPDEKSRVGFCGHGVHVGPEVPGAQHFSLFDDDGEKYFSGYLLEDDACPFFDDAWQSALQFGIADAGCTSIRDGNGKDAIS